MEPDFITAHKFSSKHKDMVMQSDKCGCFYCMAIFESKTITRWLTDDTALCPECGIDSVLPSNAGFSITIDFLKKMHDYWFESTFET